MKAKTLTRTSVTLDPTYEDQTRITGGDFDANYTNLRELGKGKFKCQGTNNTKTNKGF